MWKTFGTERRYDLRTLTSKKVIWKMLNANCGTSIYENARKQMLSDQKSKECFKVHAINCMKWQIF